MINIEVHHQELESYCTSDDGDTECRRCGDSSVSYFGCFTQHPMDIHQQITRPKAPMIDHAFTWKMNDDKQIEVPMESPPRIHIFDDDMFNPFEFRSEVSVF